MRSVLARRPLPTAFPGRSGRGSSLRTHHRCRHRQVFAGRVMPVNPRAVVDSLTRPRTMRAVVSFIDVLKCRQVHLHTVGLIESRTASGNLVRAG